MPSYTLVYFDGRGRAEICRLLFHLAGVEFEDKRIAGEEFQAYKPKTPLGQLPALEIDGKVYSQSSAMATYLAREFGFFGKTNLESLRIDEIMGMIGDFLKEAVKAFFAEESKKEEATKEFKEKHAPKFLACFQKLLKESGTGYFVGSSVTLADIAIYDLCFSMGARIPGLVDPYPDLKAHSAKIEGIDRIKKYVSGRKVTQF